MVDEYREQTADTEKLWSGRGAVEVHVPAVPQGEEEFIESPMDVLVP